MRQSNEVSPIQGVSWLKIYRIQEVQESDQVVSHDRVGREHQDGSRPTLAYFTLFKAVNKIQNRF